MLRLYRVEGVNGESIVFVNSKQRQEFAAAAPGCYYAFKHKMEDVVPSPCEDFDEGETGQHLYAFPSREIMNEVCAPLFGSEIAKFYELFVTEAEIGASETQARFLPHHVLKRELL